MFELDTSDTHKNGEIYVDGSEIGWIVLVQPKDGDENNPNYEFANLVANSRDLYLAVNRLLAELEKHGQYEENDLGISIYCEIDKLNEILSKINGDNQ